MFAGEPHCAKGVELGDLALQHWLGNGMCVHARNQDVEMAQTGKRVNAFSSSSHKVFEERLE